MMVMSEESWDAKDRKLSGVIASLSLVVGREAPTVLVEIEGERCPFSGVIALYNVQSSNLLHWVLANVSFLPPPYIISRFLPYLRFDRKEQEMTKGTQSFGKRASNKTHTACRRCGKTSFHRQKKTCSACGFPNAKIRSFQWGQKAIRRRTTGTGRMRHLKTMPRRFKNGFREGTTATSAKAKN